MTPIDAVPTIGRMVCEECDGKGCTACEGVGYFPVGIFELICERHCNMCEGQDHHWSYEGHEDTDGNPLVECRHCPALRQFTDDDDAGADY